MATVLCKHRRDGQQRGGQIYCEQFYRHFGIYEKSPNSFLPELPRSIINQFRSGGQQYSAELRQRRGRRGRSCCRLRRDGLRGAVGMGAGALCLTHF